MFKGERARERLFEGMMWLVSIILAGFLIGLGSLVIGDLPKVSAPVTVQQFVDPARSAALATQQQALDRDSAAVRARLDTADQALTKARDDYASAKETFDNWVATRAATADARQDPEVIARTHALDDLKATERRAGEARDARQAEMNAIETRLDANQRALADLNRAAEPRFRQAKFLQELKVFALRLALTLPLLGASAWMLLRRPRGEYWAMKRGFILFSAYAFFVELVPYLPEYGGYVRYGVGIVLTIVIGHYVIKGMRAYLKAREADEARAEVERVKSIQYDEALKKLAARACPGCDRSIPAADGAPVDYCVHCGMHLFNHCPSCQTRKFAFYRFCMSCGAPAVADGAG